MAKKGRNVARKTMSRSDDLLEAAKHPKLLEKSRINGIWLRLKHRKKE